MFVLARLCPCIIEQSHHSNTIMSTSEVPSNTQLEFKEQNKDDKPRKNSNVFGKLIFGITGATALGLVAATTPFVTPALRRVCLPYVPATENQIVNILRLARAPTQKTTLVDLGSGDGRVVLAAAKQGYQAHGFELNLWLVFYSRLQARLQGLHNRATFSRADLWKVNLSQFDTIVIFGVSEMMPKLQQKFHLEMKDNAQVLACRFPLPAWKPEKVIEEGIDSVWMYQNPRT